MKHERDRFLRIKSCSDCFARSGDHCLLDPLMVIPWDIIYERSARYPNGCPAPHLPKKSPAKKKKLYEYED